MPTQDWLGRTLRAIESIAAALAGAIAVTEYVPTTLYDNTRVVPAAATQLRAVLACVEVTVQADPDNGGDVFVGNATRQSIQLGPGQSETIRIDDVSKVYARAAAGNERVNWHAVV